jgi:hypothetical protein
LAMSAGRCASVARSCNAFSAKSITLFATCH